MQSLFLLVMINVVLVCHNEKITLRILLSFPSTKDIVNMLRLKNKINDNLWNKLEDRKF